jgi:translocation and assembly module TamA
MANLSNSRPAEGQRRLTLGLAIIAGLSQGTLGLAAVPAAAAQAVPAADDAVPPPAADPDEPVDVGEGAVPAPPGVTPAEPPPVPQSLDALIPPEAVTNAEAWAAAGVADPTPVVVPDDPLADPALGVFEGEADPFLTDLTPPSDPGQTPASGDIFADFALDVPEPLPPDPELAALPALAAPVLADLPELAETRISGTLVLALPAARDIFPEREEFIERFKDLSTLRELDDGEEAAPQVSARARADEELLGDILRTYGYYDGEVVRQLSGGRRARDELTRSDGETTENAAENAADAAAREPRVRFDILPGPRYRFGRIDLGALPTLPEPDASRLIAAFGIQPGDPLYADRIVDQELELRVALGESGYPFALLDEPELLIDHAREEGDLALAVQPRGKYVFGEVISSDPRFLSGRHLQRIARFDRGDVFQQSLATDLRRAIIATGLVSSVTITPRETRKPEPGQPGEVALDVAFDRAPVRTIAGAIGYGTEDGFKVEGRWEHRNLFPPEGALRLRGILGTREALASVGIRRNNFLSRDQVLTADVFASDITTEAVDARTVGTRATFEKISNFLFQKPVSWQVGAEVLYTDERNRTARTAPGGPVPRRTFLIGSVFGSVTLDGSDDLLDPTEGYRATLFVAPEVSREGGSESFYLRTQADASYYQSVGSTVLAARLRAATIQGAGIDDIAPSRRLYGGGGASVRGYGFQGVGPRDAVGNPTGGASLVEAAVEARIETGLFDGAIELVPFLDAGSVARSSTPDFGTIRFGAGVGLRYKTSFGPIRIDVATPLNRTEFDSPVVVYVSLGQAF